MTDLKELLQRELKLERKDQQKSAAITTGIGVLLFLSSIFWVAMAGTIPPIGEPNWRTIGMLADFGNQVEGSGDVNNFHAPSPTPADRPANTNTQSHTSNSNPKPSNVQESNTNSSQTTTASTSETPNANPANSNSEPKSSNSNTNPGGGSNDGNGKNIGNQGHPDAKELNKGGLFAFGDGIGGTTGRRPIKLDLPNYTVQQEARIKFSFIISPEGKVVFAKAEATPYTDLAQIGKDAIMKWRFNEVDEGEGNLKTSVTINFRLQ